MIKVIIDNSISKVIGLSKEQFDAIRKIMSYLEVTGQSNFKQRGRMSFQSVRKYLIDKRGVFPTGLLYLFQKYCSKLNILPEWEDTRIAPQPHEDAPQSNFAFTPYPEQLEAAEAVKTYDRGIIVAPTGVGKSVIIALVIDKLKVPTLVVVPNLNLKAQLTASLKEIFGDSNVGGLLKSGKRKYFIAVENVDALDPKVTVEGYHSVIIDEFHHAAAATFRALNLKAWSGIYHRVGLTATPFRNKSEERLLLESVLSQTIYQIQYQHAVEKGYIVPIEAYSIDLPPIPNPKPKYFSYHQVYSDMIVNNEYMHSVVSALISNLILQDKSALVLTKQVLHGQNILDTLMSEHGIEVPFMKGENDNNTAMLADFNNTLDRVVIGTEGVLGEGADTKPCEYVIDAGGGKSKNRMMQKAGRGTRKYGDKESCKLIIFNYPHNKWLANHFQECVSHIKTEYGIDTIKLTI